MKEKFAKLQHFKENFEKFSEFVESSSIAGWVKIQTSEKAQIAVGTLILMYLIATPVLAANTDPFTAASSFLASSETMFAVSVSTAYLAIIFAIVLFSNLNAFKANTAEAGASGSKNSLSAHGLFVS